MALNGAALRFVSGVTIAAGTPGGTYLLTLSAQPLGSYPALGETIAALLAALSAKPESRAKVPAGVKPDNVFIESNIGSNWSYDPGQGTMGVLRNWSDLVGTEHATGVYSAGELASTLRLTFKFPLFGDMSR